MKDLKNYINDIDNLNSFLLNQDQKKLIKEILVNTNNSNKENLDNVFQLLIQRVKTGFVLDVAPSVDAKQIAILKKQEKLSFTNDLLNTNKNTLIIGENYDALKNLLVIERQKEQIGGDYNYDLIYIDPPYNTDSAKDDGNNLSEKDNVEASKFIYRDKFSRTGWLNMMNERLKMARQLLKEDGVIFVSIDDNEQAYLKVLMDEIFGEENFVTSFPVISNLKGRQVNTNFAKTHEYLVCYKMKYFDFNNLDNKYATNNMPIVYADRKNEIEVDEKGEYMCLNTLENTNDDFNDETRPNLFFPIYYSTDLKNISTIKNNICNNEIWPSKFKNGIQKVWRWQKSKVENEKFNLKIKINSNNEIKIYTKNRDFSWIPKSLIFSKKINNKSGNDLFNSIITKIKTPRFNTAKPIELIKFLISLHPNPNLRVLDFFAGSGTTGHAVLDLNREEGGNRTFTLVTNNENNIGIDVCYERLYRINNGKGSKGEVNFDWIKKNEPYNQNLDVFEIKYYDTDVLANNNEIIKQDFKNMLNDFDLSNVNKINEQEILLNLTALKPVEGKDSNESN